MATTSDHKAQSGGGWRLAILLVGVLAVVLVLRNYGGGSESVSRPLDPRFDPRRGAGTLTLALDAGEGPQQRLEIPLAESVLLIDAMQEAARRDKGWQAQWAGRGEGMFLTELAGKSNEGGGGNNWIYHLNGEPGTVGVGACTVSKGDDILWKFGP